MLKEVSEPYLATRISSETFIETGSFEQSPFNHKVHPSQPSNHLGKYPHRIMQKKPQKTPVILLRICKNAAINISRFNREALLFE